MAPPAADREDVRTKRAGKISLIISSLLNSGLFSGIIFGWAPLQLLLQDEGQYGYLCGPDDLKEASGMCPAQASKFASIFAQAAFLVNAVSLFSGMLLDWWGGRLMSFSAYICILLGLVAVGISDARTSEGIYDWFALGYSFLAIGGQMTLFVVFPTAFELPEYQTLVFASNSCLFDGSSVVFQIMSSIHDAFGYTRRDLFLAFAVVSCPLYIMNIFLWQFSGGPAIQYQNSLARSPRIQHTPPRAPAARTFNGESTKIKLHTIGDISQKRPTTDLTLLEQLRTWDFYFILFYASVGILRANLYIGCNEDLLMNLGDNSASNNRFFSKVFGYVLPLGFVFIPAIDLAVESSMTLALHVTNFLGISVALLMLVPYLRVQCITFLFFAGFRAFLYGVMGAFIGETFGLRTLGRITGCVFTSGSIINLIQVPILEWTNYRFQGDTGPLAVLMISLGMIILVSVPKRQRNGIVE